MKVRVVEFDNELIAPLAAFNARLADGGSKVRFPPPPSQDAVGPTFHQGLKEIRYLALEEGISNENTVRGAYALKFQEFWLAGDVIPVADLRLPVSEAIVNRSYAHVAVGLLADAQKRQPILYGLGMGGAKEPVARLLKAAGWQLFTVPFYFQVIRPFAFFRNIVALRKTVLRRIACDFLAYSGMGSLSVALATMLHPRRVPSDKSCRADAIDEFGSWADDIWEASKAQYGFCSVRDAATLRKMYPRQVPNCTYLRVSAKGQPVGWSVLLNSMLTGHSKFGNMRLGSIIDCFADSEAAEQVLERSREYLIRQGVDLIISNQSHRIWGSAFRRCGFVAGPSNFLFASSRALKHAMEEKQICTQDVHVNRGDGDGPINL